MSPAILTIASRNYGSWSLRGWLLCRMAGLEFETRVLPPDDPGARAELLLLSPSFLVPRLEHNGGAVWDTLAIAEYLAEIKPKAGLFPADIAARSQCRSVSGEMHAGFANLRSALPMNIKARYPGHKVFAGARGDIERIAAIWRECLSRYDGPFLFGRTPTVADAMYAPVTTRFATYDVHIDRACDGYGRTIAAWPLMQEWAAAAAEEPDDVEELDVEF